MKITHFHFTFLLFFLSCSAFAQVQIDKQIQLTGTGTDAKINGIRSATDSLDATSVKAVQSGGFNYAVATGSSNNLVLNITPSISSYQAGMVFNFISNQNITGPVTLAVNSLSAQTIKKNINQNIGQCDIQNGQMVTVVYDGTNFQMTSVTVQATPTVAIAGPNQLVTVTSTTLAANTPTSGTGLWTITSGSGGNLSNASSPVSTFTGVAGKTYILNWTISACGSSSSSVDTITFGGVPATISGLLVWYDANDASTITYSSGNSVSAWADKSGNGFNQSNATMANQPALITNDINSLPALRFSSTNNQFLVNSAFTINLFNRSIFIVVKENDANVGDSRWISIKGAVYDWNSNNGYTIGNDLQGYVEISNGDEFMKYTYGGGDYAPLNIYSDITNAGSTTLYLGGISRATGSNPNAFTSVGGLSVGGGYDQVSQMGQFDGDMAEVIIYNRALTTAESDQVGAYLSAKWGISYTP